MNTILKIRVRLKIKISKIHCQGYSSWKVLFFGSDAFSLPSLQQLYNRLVDTSRSKLNTLEVITGHSKSKANVVYQFSEKANLPILKWPPDPSWIQKRCFDIGIVVSFGYLIPKKVIDAFPMGMINVHGSLLPRWRGASPIIHAILNGDSETGVSIMKINPHHFDTGPVLLQRKCQIGSDEMLPSLYNRMSHLGAACLLECIDDLPNCLNKAISQNLEGVTYAPRITPDIARVNWREKTSRDIYNMYRALYSIYDLKTEWNAETVKLRNIVMFKKNISDCDLKQLTPGSILWFRGDRLLLVRCQSGFISINSLTFRGKCLSHLDFYNGYLSKTPQDLWILS